jgi:hypothetical protein
MHLLTLTILFLLAGREWTYVVWQDLFGSASAPAIMIGTDLEHVCEREEWSRLKISRPTSQNERLDTW